jgi:hypothetical protein
MRCFDHVTTPCGDMILIGGTTHNVEMFFSRKDAERGRMGKGTEAFIERGQIDRERFPFLMARLW